MPGPPPPRFPDRLRWGCGQNWSKASLVTLIPEPHSIQLPCFSELLLS